MSYTEIIKRDGRTVKFNSSKITKALTKAGDATGEFDNKIAKSLTLKVLALLDATDGTPTVEWVQDIVEEVLLNSPYRNTAKEYIIYRDQHSKLREIKTKANVDLIDQYLSQLDWQVNENSNMAFSLQGLNNYISSEVSKTYWLNKIYSKAIRDAHNSGAFHIHDLNLLSVYCVGWDLYDLLIQGFKGASGKIESRPPKHFRTALGQIVNFFYTLQGEAAGAQAFSNFDTLLAPFIRFDNLDYMQVKQALQEFVFNINVPTRTGFQTPFTNVTMDLQCSKNYYDQNVIIGGEIQEFKYCEFQKEMDILNTAFCEVMTEGDASGRVFTFPIPTYNITSDFDWDSPNLTGLWNMTAKYGIPYFSNFINSDMKPEDARSMCCRLRLDSRELNKRGGGLFGSNPLTGSVGVVTINLPRLGYTSIKDGVFDKDLMFSNLSNLLTLASSSLEIKRKVLERYTDANLYPYTKHYLSNIKGKLGEYWKNHFSTIGIVGMNELCLNTIGEDVGSENGRELALEICNFIREQLVDIQKRTGNNYNFEATPAEGTSYRLAKKDKESFPDIKTANDSGEPFYTNSTLLPVDYTDDPFEVLDLQDELQTKYTGGSVIHLYAGEQIHDAEVIKNLVRTVCSNYRLPYFSFSPTFSVCTDHGYLDGEQTACPKCGKETEVYSRVVGYLRPVAQWNKGKKEEYKMRKEYVIKENS